jgi:uncharacterized protein with PQ loop repeat
LPESPLSAQRPAAVTAIASAFFLIAGYLILLAAVMLISPGTVSMAAGSPLLSGLELAGPYMFLLIGGVGGAIGFGLLKLNNWARRAAIVAALLGMVMLIPSVSAAAVDFRPALFWNGLGVVLRMVVIWYLYQTPVAETFRRR